jgi:NSS family neurotransmitter:Na+ symporter
MKRFSRVGFILAAAGSAVGLGNIWKFPYITGEYGGGAFVLVYLITIAFVGFSVLVAEMYIGSKGASDAANSFMQLAPSKHPSWKYTGFMGFTGLVIMTFYSVVIGWIFHNIYTTLVYGLPTDIPTAEANFNALMTTQPFTQLVWHTIATLIVVFVLFKGIKKGIEKMNMFLMPALVFILIALLFYAMSFSEGFAKSLDFMFYPHWEKLTPESIVKAIGHAFFTLSIGMGAILIYSVSLPKHTNIAKAAFYVVLLDTGIALIAGIIIFAFLFSFGEAPSKGPGLVFQSLPVIFSKLGFMGTITGLLFFLALAFAGLTSSVSLVEPAVEHFINHFKHARHKAVLTAGGLYYAVGILVILSTTQGITDYLSIEFESGTKTLFDMIEYTTDVILLPIAGLLMAIFIGYKVDQNALKNALQKDMGTLLFRIWHISVRYVAPIALLFMFLNLLGIITQEDINHLFSTT